MITVETPVTTLPTRRWSAIGTWCEVVVCVPDAGPEVREQIADAAQVRAARLVVELDLACSRFREDSELSRLRHGMSVPVSAMLDAAVGAGLRTARATGGLVDPTVAGALIATGYDDDLAAVRARPHPETDETADPTVAQAAPGWWRVFHDHDARHLLLPHGVDLDLGASAKAWLADVIAADLVGRSILPAAGGVLVNLGGDLATAGSAPAAGWRIAVDDGTAAAPPPAITIRGGGLATSSTRLRTWRQGARRRHHIVDPRTGDTAPAVWQAVTVAARTCELANAASTAAVVLGEEAPRWLTAKGVHARLRHRNGTLRLVGGWPEEAAA